MKITKTLMSDFYCTECGKFVMTLRRPKSKIREGGHLKYLYCPHCREVRNCVEVSEGNAAYTKEDFAQEFQAHIFQKGVRVTNVNTVCE